MGMLRTEATPRRVEGIWSEPPSELLDSFYVPTEEDIQWAISQLEQLKAQKDPAPSSPVIRPPSPPHSKYLRHLKFHPHELKHHRFEPPPHRSPPKVSRKDRLMMCYSSITSPMRRVPDEVWQAIFTQALEDQDVLFQLLPAYKAPPSPPPKPLMGGGPLRKMVEPASKAAYAPKAMRIQLLSVCRRWRNILLGTPDIWTHISIDCSTPGKALRIVDTKTLSYLKWALFTRSGDAQLSIDFMTTGEKWIEPRLPKALVETISSTVDRWRSLKLLTIQAPSVWWVPRPPSPAPDPSLRCAEPEEEEDEPDYPELAVPHTIPSLTTLTLDFDDLQTGEEEAIKAIPSAPVLKHLYIVNLINILKMPEAAKRFPSITHLQTTLLYMQPADRFFTSFIHTLPNLTHFHFSGSLRWLPDKPPYPKPTTFNQIQVFSLESKKESMGFILSLFTLPNLTRLRLKVDWHMSSDVYTGGFQKHCLEFLDRASNGSKVTHLTLAGLQNATVSAIITKLENVEKVEIYIPRPFDGMEPIHEMLRTSLVWDPASRVKELKKLKLVLYDDGRWDQIGFTRPWGELDVRCIIDICKSRLVKRNHEEGVARLEELSLSIVAPDHRLLKDSEKAGIQALRLVSMDETGDIFKILLREGKKWIRQVMMEESTPW